MKRFFVVLVLMFSFQASCDGLITNEIVENSVQKYGPQSKKRFMSIYKNLIVKLKNASEIKKINTVNTWFNYIQYVSDKQLYKTNDYWATIYEFVGRGAGDCEDYTIAKYYTLKELGVDPKKMKFTYVIYQDSRGRKIPHMVLAYFLVPKPKSKQDILILDNTNRQVLPASKRPDIIKVLKMINGDTGAKSKKWKMLEKNMREKKL